MLGLFGEKLVSLVPLLELHRFVSNAQRAHLQLAEIFIRRRGGDGDCCEQPSDNQHAPFYPHRNLSNRTALRRSVSPGKRKSRSVERLLAI
jgi:hypothetical protein